MKLDRIVIVGTSGSGKSTLAELICKSCGHKNIELDSLNWKPNWVSSTPEELKVRLIPEIKDCNKFVIHGNYGSIRDLVWRNVDTVIWLDYRKSIVMWRVIKRTLRRVVTKEKLWSGNVETLRSAIFSKDGIIAWAWNTYSKRKQQYQKLINENPYCIETIFIFRNPKETKKWIKERVLTTASTG